MAKHKPDLVKKSVADVALQPFRAGTAIEGVTGYELVLNDPCEVMIRAYGADPTRGPRYFTVTVKELR